SRRGGGGGPEVGGAAPSRHARNVRRGRVRGVLFFLLAVALGLTRGPVPRGRAKRKDDPARHDQKAEAERGPEDQGTGTAPGLGGRRHGVAAAKQDAGPGPSGTSRGA